MICDNHVKGNYINQIQYFFLIFCIGLYFIINNNNNIITYLKSLSIVYHICGIANDQVFLAYHETLYNNTIYLQIIDWISVLSTSNYSILAN